MNNKTKGKLHRSRLQALLAGAALFAGLGLVATSANASIVGTVGGVPTGADHYETFDSIASGSHSGSYTTPSGIVVTFAGEGSAVNGAESGRYAAPFLSGDNGLNFGGQPDGADATTYLTSGAAGSSVTLALVGPTRYMGLLWGSVDSYNTLTFYNGSTLVGQFTGADVTSAANGDQGENGTYYVNINLSDSFTSVVATSSSYAFEFDNVAFSASPLSVPEPGTVGIFLLGLLLLGSAYRLKGRRLS
ncbi:MAG TPA: PEP-CTERM sorting domain-containing protein [Rhodanobacter sp.]|nr:PEP-CTERM sorting domain-containing protein [Rhodanobacter sp.]